MSDKQLMDVAIARQVGPVPALIYEQICFWHKRAVANGKHFHDGRTWIFNSVRAWGELFPYLTQKQIRTALEKLEEAGLIATGCYNQTPYDRTKWYCPLGQHDLPSGANGVGQQGAPIPEQIPEQIPEKEREAHSADAERSAPPSQPSLLDDEPRAGPPKPEPPKAKPKTDSARGTYIPTDWTPSHADREYARTELRCCDRTVDRVAADFRDYWTAASGARARKRDWPATWRTWVRREAERGRPAGGAAGQGQGRSNGHVAAGSPDSFLAAAARVAARRAGLSEPDIGDPIELPLANGRH